MKRKPVFSVMLVLLALSLAFVGCDLGGGDGGKGGDGGGNITYTVVHNGNAATTTTSLYFSFSKAVALTTADITLTSTIAAIGAATVTPWYANSPSVSGGGWELKGISVTGAGDIKVKVTKDGVESDEKTVTVNYVQGSSITWTQRDGGYTGFNLGGSARSVVWNGTRFITVGYSEYGGTATGAGASYSTADGTSWSSAISNANRVEWGLTRPNIFNTVAWGNDKFVAGGSVLYGSGASHGKNIAYSVNGQNGWTLVESEVLVDPASGNNNSIVSGIAFGADKFIAVGGEETPVWPGPVTRIKGRIAVSTDGEDWTAATDATAFGGTFINCVVFGNDKFVAGADEGKLAYSADGETWTAITSPFDADISIRAIAFGDGKFIAGGDKGTLAHSADGITWTAVTDSKFDVDDAIRGIAWGAGQFVAVGDLTKMSVSDDGGITWVSGKRPLDYGGTTFHTAYGVAYGAKRFVVVGHQGRIAYSNEQE